MKTIRSWVVVIFLGAVGAALTVSVARQNNLLTACPLKGEAPVPVPEAPAGVRAEGRVVCYPGSQVEVGSEMAGLVSLLPIEENQAVEKGAPIAELRSDELRATLAEARARVTELEAERKLAEEEIQRQQQLLSGGATSRQEFDRASRDLEVASARCQSAAATVARIEATLVKTRIIAPIGGVVVRRYVQLGETIESNTRLARLADLSRLRVEAEVDEYDAGRVKVGQRVAITAEGYPGQSWSGGVEEVPGLVVDKSLEPRDPARPIDVRVLQVKIAFAAPTPLKLGQRVEVQIMEGAATAHAHGTAERTESEIVTRTLSF
jgi:RND family efflux transporter MFP subunit